jgi:crotonobetainyl-CoA:carnitine CoA-transferase CaiB-like acyl-CoA transferase
LVLGDESASLCAKVLAELGAELLEPPLEADPKSLCGVVSRVDALLEAGPPGVLERWGIAPEELRRTHPRLILASVTPFGHTGPRRGWSSCDLVAAAAGGQLHVTGCAGREPLQLFGAQALSLASLHAAVGLVLALLERDATGRGTRVDVSLQEAVASGLDHVLVRYFSTGAVPGRAGSRQWNEASVVVACRDGHLLLYPFQQWDTLVEWMAVEGLAGDLTDREYQDPGRRRARFEHIVAAISQWTSLHTRSELFETGQLMQLPWAPVCTLAEVLASPQLAERGYFLPAKGREGVEPGPPYVFSSPQEPPRIPARGRPRRAVAHPGRPLAGVRVLDFTRVLAGPFATRIFADFGAEVIKIQTRRTATGADADDQPYFAMWNRNKRSVTIDLDRPEGRDVVLELVRRCDVVAENFAPRVLDNWDLGYPVLRHANPQIVLLRMSAAGQTGPWRDTVAYGPTIHALSGLTALTAYPGGSPLGPGFAYSDVVAGLYGALAVTSALYARARTGQGCAVDLSEYEAVVGLVAPAFGEDPGEAERAAPYGCFPCRGDDRWCAFAAFDERQWQALCGVLGLTNEAKDPRFEGVEARRQHSAELRALLEARTTAFAADDLAGRLQEKGIPAAPVQDARDLAEDPHLAERGFFAKLRHPVLGEFTTDRGAIRLEGEEPLLRPPPLLGQDNDAVFGELLGWAAEKIAEMRARGVIA